MSKRQKVPVSAGDLDRRQFLGTAGVALGALAGCGQPPGEGELEAAGERAAAISDDEDESRREAAAKLRVQLAQEGRAATPARLPHPSNGDEGTLPGYIGSFSKGLPHDARGEVVRSAYQALLSALRGGDRLPALLEALPLGGDRRLVNPQAGVAFELEGADPQRFVQRPPPAFSSREEAAEIAENYWMALLRDVPFARYAEHPVAATAAADLSLFGADFKGPKAGGAVTPGLLFRGLTPGDQVGPWLSQFFYLPIPFGASEVAQRVTTLLPANQGGADYMTSFDGGPGSWLDVQRGSTPPQQVAIDPVRRYLRSGRDLAQWVHIDVLFQAYLQAGLILMELNGQQRGALLDDGHPYKRSRTQDGFGTFGDPQLAALIAEVAPSALRAVWFQKWQVHRRLRPEAFAARVHRTLYARAGYPVHPEILASVSSASRLGRYLPSGNALLPQAFPEGSPLHPSYGAGHATVAGACVTILKAWYKEDVALGAVAPLRQPSDDGTALIPYAGADAGRLTIGGELNKLAANVALGRNIAGVHWRSDATESLLLGEAVAMQLLREKRRTYSERFGGFSLTRFDGTQITI